MEPTNPSSPIEQQPTMPPASGMPTSTPPEHKKVGPIIAVAAVILVLIIAALYIFASRMNSSADDQIAPQTQQQSVQPVTSTSDDISDIEADLDMSIDGLDAQNF